MTTTYLPCNCLNVTLHLIEKPSPFQDNFQTLVRPLVSDALWENDVYKGTLSLGGVVIQHNELIHSRIVKGWTVFRCINCMTDVYATLSSDKSFIAINHHMVNKENENPTRSSPFLKFSPAFHVMVDYTTSSEEESDTFVPSFSDVEASALFSALQSNVQKYYDEEQKRMTKRISAYMEQEEAELKKTYARALKDRDAIWSKIKLHLFEKRKNESTTAGRECVNELMECVLRRDKHEKADKKESAEGSFNEHLGELNRVKSLAFEWRNSYDQNNERINSSNKIEVNYNEGDDDDDDNELTGSIGFMGVFEVDDVISPTMNPAAEDEDVSFGSFSCSSEGNDFWEQEPNVSFAGFSSVEEQDRRVPKPSSSLPIFIQRKNCDRPPSQAEDSQRATEGESANFCYGLVVDSQHKSVPFSDKASSFSVPKKRMTFL